MSPRLPSNFDFDEDEERELRLQVTRANKHRKKLLSNYDCRDPDHPGCERCQEVNNEEMDSEE